MEWPYGCCVLVHVHFVVLAADNRSFNKKLNNFQTIVVKTKSVKRNNSNYKKKKNYKIIIIIWRNLHYIFKEKRFEEIEKQ